MIFFADSNSTEIAANHTSLHYTQLLSRYTSACFKVISWQIEFSFSTLILNVQICCYSKGFIKPFAHSEDL